MPGTVSDAAAAAAAAPPSVALSFANNFWGRDDVGVGPLLDRMQNAKTTCDELKAFYNARAALEDEYSRKLFALCRKPLGSTETGTLRAALDTVRGEIDSMGKQHAAIAAQVKAELEEPLAAFAGGMKERRKIVQTGIERLLKTKQSQMAHVNKSRDRYEQDCLRIKGYLAQGHMVMGQEERKNKAKLEKTQINMANNSTEYETAIKVMEETIGRWNKEWKAACDKFQDFEEERLDFTKSSLWTFANIASTVCVSDDASCEKIRLSLENCEVEKDIATFIKTSGTGQEIPDPPRYINFCRGDLHDTPSEASEDENYSVAQFQRTINPAFRSSSPNPSTYESHHDPESDLAQSMAHGGPATVDPDGTPTPSKTNSGRPAPLNYRQPEPNVPPNYKPSQHGDVPQVPHNEYPTEGMTMYCRTGPPSITGSGLSANTRPSSRDSQSEYSNPASYTSAEPMSGKSSPMKGRPPTNEPEMPGVAVSPEKTVQKKRSGFFSNSPFRRKSRKEADHQAHIPASNRNTWAPASASRINLNSTNAGSASKPSSPSKPHDTNGRAQDLFSHAALQQAPEGEEPADLRASFQLNVGNNVFDVASPDSQSTPKASRKNLAKGLIAEDLSQDPIVQALADLKQAGGGVGMNKQSSTRVTADRYHGIQTPAPENSVPAMARPTPISAVSADRLAAQRGTPPPAYEGSTRVAPPPSALGVPQPAFTSKEMRARTENWGAQSAYGGSNPGSRNSQAPRPGTSQGNMRSRSPAPGGMVPRATSPQPLRARSPGPAVMNGAPQHYAVTRSRSPGPGMMQPHQEQAPLTGQQGRYRAASPNPNLRARSPGPGMMHQQQQQGPPSSQGDYRSASPNPYGGIHIGGSSRGPTHSQSRQNSGGMEMQLSNQDVQRYDQDGNGSGRSRQGMMGGRPHSAFGGDPYMAASDQWRNGVGMDPKLKRERSKSTAAPVASQKQILHYARALYSYTPAIPEELGFAKGDILAVLRLQDDGWWEAEISKGRSNIGRMGLVPSNYLQRC